MFCNKCGQKAATREILNICFCLKCDIWLCKNPSKISPTDFNTLLPENLIKLSSKELDYGQQVAIKINKEIFNMKEIKIIIPGFKDPVLLHEDHELESGAPFIFEIPNVGLRVIFVYLQEEIPTIKKNIGATNVWNYDLELVE